LGIFGRFRKKKGKPKEHNKPFKGKKKVSFDIADLGMLGAFAKSEELKELFEKTKNTHKQKILDMYGIDIDSEEFKKLIKLRTLRSSDPKMMEDIRRSKEVYSKVYGTKVVMEFTREELESLRKSIGSLGGSWMDDLRRRLSDPAE
jgi:hypothetical protein